jgi:hypothetical protein
VFDSSIGISRSTADQYPGLPLIVLGRDEGGGAIGTSDVTYRGYVPSLSFADAITMQRDNTASDSGANSSIPSGAHEP